MFKRSFQSKDRVGKANKVSKRSLRDDAKLRLLEKANSPPSEMGSPVLTSAIITIVVGKDQRLFAAHEDVLCRAPFFAMLRKEDFFEANQRHVTLADEQPETFSHLLEYLYKGDYYPRLLQDKKRKTWVLEDGAEQGSPKLGGRGAVEATIFHDGVGDHILRDTAVYCAAERYGLEELKKLALRKQGLVSNIDVGTILRSARFAYDHTPDTDSRLRAHYLSLIIRSRRIFKRSGTMQEEMQNGGSKLFFDLFVAMTNYIDDLTAAGAVSAASPRAA